VELEEEETSEDVWGRWFTSKASLSMRSWRLLKRPDQYVFGCAVLMDLKER